MKRRHLDHGRSVSAAMTLAGLATLSFVLLPLPFIILQAFSKNSYALVSAQGVTLEWFRSFFNNERFMSALENSLAISAITTVASLAIATPTALVAVRHRFAGRDLLILLVSSPLLIPGVITGTAALSFVAQAGIGPGFWPITIAMGPSDIRLGFPPIFYLMHQLFQNLAPSLPVAAVPLSRIYLHPTAIAAWVGMFATALNLLPSSQLDGGHIVYALAPRAHRIVSWMTVIALVYLGRMHHQWSVWSMWAVLLIAMNIFTYRQQQAPEFPRLPVSRWLLAIFAMIMLALTFTVSPFRLNI